MKLKLDFSPYVLDFRFDAGTSRGVMKQRKTWFVKLYEESRPEKYGLGECAPLEGLSSEDISQMDFELERLQTAIADFHLSDFTDDPLKAVSDITDRDFPSIRFGLETAVLDLINGGKKIIFDNGFRNGDMKIPINGLIWMGDKPFMKEQIDEKMKSGFGCIKMKVGAIDFEDELKLLRLIRKRGGENLDLRIDANGAFPNREAFRMIKKLEELNLHSIEQPIMPRQPEAMSLICERSEVPVALDEDLIGLYTTTAKAELLDYIKPDYIVLKPSLIGGLASSMEWIKLAQDRSVGWWVTSALESNVGLNAIAQFTGEYSLQMHQGLGTGQLFRNNFESPLQIRNGGLEYNSESDWDLTGLTFS